MSGPDDNVTDEPDPRTEQGRRLIVALSLLNHTIEKSAALQAHNLQTYGFAEPLPERTPPPIPLANPPQAAAGPTATPTPESVKPPPTKDVPEEPARPIPLKDDAADDANRRDEQLKAHLAGNTDTPETPKKDPDRGMVRDIVQAIIDGFRKADQKTQGVPAAPVKGFLAGLLGRDRARKLGRFAGRVAGHVRKGWQAFRKDVKKRGFRKAVGSRVGGGMIGAAKKGATLAGKAGGAVLKGLFEQMSRLLSPLGQMATYMNNAASGIGLFTKVMNIFAMTGGAILLPFVFLLSAGLLALSDVLWTKLLPTITDFFAFMLKNGVPVLEAFVGAISKTIDALGHFWGWIAKKIGLKDEDKGGFNNEGGAGGRGPASLTPFADNGESRDDMAKRAEKAYRNRLQAEEAFKRGDIGEKARDRVREMEEGLYKNFKGTADENRGKFLNPDGSIRAGGPRPEFEPDAPKQDQPPGRSPGPPPARPGEPPRPGLPGGMGGILRDLMRSFQLSNQPKASITGLQQVGSQKLIESLNADPLEQKMQQRWNDLFRMMGTVIDKLDPQPQGQFNAGGR